MTSSFGIRDKALLLLSILFAVTCDAFLTSLKRTETTSIRDRHSNEKYLRHYSGEPSFRNSANKSIGDVDGAEFGEIDQTAFQLPQTSEQELESKPPPQKFDVSVGIVGRSGLSLLNVWSSTTSFAVGLLATVLAIIFQFSVVLNGGGPYGNVRYLDEDDIPFEVVDPSLGREIDDDRPFDLFRMRRVEKDDF